MRKEKLGFLFFGVKYLFFVAVATSKECISYPVSYLIDVDPTGALSEGQLSTQTPSVVVETV